MCSDITIDAKTGFTPTESKPDYALKTFAEIIEFRANTEPDKQAFAYFLDGEEVSIALRSIDESPVISLPGPLLSTSFTKYYGRMSLGFRQKIKP